MIRDQILGNENVQPNTKEMEKLKAIFPQFFDESGQFLQDRFHEMLKSNDVVLSKEGYELKFLGKSYARYLSSTATETFLSPLEVDNAKPENMDSENLYIIGDNLDALKHLLNSYAGKIKCIYIDPPYNTGSDGFVYPDNFKFNAKELSQAIGIEEEEADRVLNLAGKSSHSAWLTFMYPRLILARELLSEDGALFISIDDNEQSNLKMICDEIFGEENFVSEIIWKRKRGRDNSAKWFSKAHEYCFVYSKKKDEYEVGYLSLDETTKKAYKNPDNDPRGIYRMLGCWARGTQGGVLYDFTSKDGRYFNERKWLFSKENLKKMDDEDKLIFRGENIYRKMFIFENKGQIPETLWDDVSNAANASDEIKFFFDDIVFDTPKPTPYIKRMIEITANSKDIILDFFSGSATTAHAVMQLNAEDGGNRKYIMVQLPEVIKEDKPAYQAGYRTIDEIGRERIKRAAKKIKEETGAEIDYGFKTFQLEPVKQDTLNKMIGFDPIGTFLTEDMISVFDTDKASGKNSILATWLNEDGYGLTAEATSYILKDYEANVYQDSLYIINEGLQTEDVMGLVKRLETMELDINRVVVYPYSVEFNVMHELKKNIKNLRNNKSVEVIERY